MNLGGIECMSGQQRANFCRGCNRSLDLEYAGTLHPGLCTRYRRRISGAPDLAYPGRLLLSGALEERLSGIQGFRGLVDDLNHTLGLEELTDLALGHYLSTFQ